MKNELITIFSDGGARGNPGPSAIGVVLHLPQDTVELSQYIGSGTNNQAEYQAVIAGLEKIQELNFTNQEINWFLDSELVVKQLNGEYKIKDKILQEKVKIIQDLISKMNLKINFTHVARDKNKQADKLVNQALDQHKSRGGYTFIEILISSLIFVSVIIVATAGFGQIVKYRAIVNANLDVNQVARTLSDQITSDIKNADAEITVEYRAKEEQAGSIKDTSKTFLLVKYKDDDFMVRVCDDDSNTLFCANKIDMEVYNEPYQLGVPLKYALVVAHSDNSQTKIKIYHFLNNIKKPDDNFWRSVFYGVKFKELVYTSGTTIVVGDIFPNDEEGFVDYIPQSKANVAMSATEYTGSSTPSRFDLDFYITTSNFFSDTAKDYEKAWLTLHTVASVRDFK